METLRTRLKRYGIDRSVEGRHAALLALASSLPAPILAERIGIHPARAAQWVRLAGGTYADYVATRTPPSNPNVIDIARGTRLPLRPKGNRC
ncbi:MAG TPA: hypothetical protein VG295_02910 [Solirubrobacteraceae bacterium]|nr:hypothetical protein [Solirubrobacteraceae bacterium]